MTNEEIATIQDELRSEYPDARIILASNHAEVIAELSPGRAIAVVEASAPHFHQRMTEVYRVLKGTLYVACGGHGYVLGTNQMLTIPPGSVHSARAAGSPAWLEVLSDPPWTPEDHLNLR